MKTLKIVYWISTAIIALMMTYSAYVFTDAKIEQGFHHLGYPSYFSRTGHREAGGCRLLVAPVGSIKEWAYAGFSFTFISAGIAHLWSQDPMPMPVM